MTNSSNIAQLAQTTIFIKDNRIFCHKLARFYYTTYDVQRSEDVINPRTSHSNIMLLADVTSSNKNQHETDHVHPFLYARVLGIYHVNVIYTGTGAKGYDPMRFDFLHVRWFQLEVSETQKSNKCPHLECISFSPIAGKNAFGLLDPELVLRSCHIIPAYSLGKRNLEGIRLSDLSKDENDWKNYYINRYCVLFLLFFY